MCVCVCVCVCVCILTLHCPRDTAHDLILEFAHDVDGYISRVNPDVYEDFTVARYDVLLGTLHEQYGLAGMMM